MPDSRAVGEQSSTHGHVRTHGFDSKGTRTEVDLDGTNGGIDVDGS